MLPPAIFLMGPTGSGKTGLAVELAQQFPVELISVDSALVYRGMNIGTAKPDAETLSRAPHHLIDIIEPTDTYSAAQFCDDAIDLMSNITARGKIPLLVGGTMLYFKALQCGLSNLPAADAATRAQLDAEASRVGWPALHARLADIDGETAARLKPTDTQRIQRALEVYILEGKPMSQIFAESRAEELPYRLLKIALMPSDRGILHQHIAKRFDAMLMNGFVEEVRALRDNYPSLSPSMPSMRCVGYRQIWQYLEGEFELAMLREKGIAATRQLAKRQMTWLRAMDDTIVIDSATIKLLYCIINSIRQFI